MRLKSLEIKGFKSFANPTILYFDENVTGVVGPNGSGKSNVVDAFRWVLGEQKSKELRLEQMGDVLFNGSVGKKQANLAEVSITFDNTKNLLPTEYNNVKVTRALYRSGESEYRINDVNCRLKDIHSLLMDTGIGSNSYSIIELGMVDDILHDKENARRRMFEQAAGISKFKKRKKETIQKLNLTNADLERIEDLLFEIENNLKELEKQAKRTKRYFEIKEKYREASTQLYRIKWDALETSEKDVHHQISVLKDEYNDLSVKLSRQEASLEQEKRKNLHEERNLSDFQKKLNELLDQIRQFENEKNLLEQKKTYAQKSIDSASENLKITKPQLVEVEQRTDELKVQLLRKEKEYAEEKVVLTDKQKELDQITEKFQQNKHFQETKFKELQESQSIIFESDKELAVLQNRLENYVYEKKQNTSKSQAIKSNISGQRTQLEVYNKNISLLDSEILALQEKEHLRLTEIAKVEVRISERKETTAKLNRKIDALDNEQKLLRSMVENLEGFPESVKYLHSKWEAKKIILSDVINCEDKYRAAVEQFLQNYLSYFIVENPEEARSAISLLQNAQKGKAQFFLLDQVVPQKPTQNIGLQALSELIEVDKPYEDLLSMICKDVFLAPENEIYANELLEKYPHITLLDTTGSMLRSKFQLFGGSVGLFEGKKIGRKKRLDMLSKLIQKEKSALEKASKNLNADIEKLQELKQARYEQELKQKERSKSDVEKSQLLLKTKLEDADNEISKLEARNKEISELEAKLEQELNTTRNEKAALEERIAKLRSAVSKQDSEIETLNAHMSEARSKFNEQNIKLIQLENFTATLQKDIDYQNIRSRDLRQKLYDSQKTLKDQESELAQTTIQFDEMAKELEDKYEEKKSKQKALGDAEQEYFKARAKLSEIEDEIRTLSKNINDKQYLINQLKDKLNDFKFRKNSIKERLNIEFGMDIWKLIDLDDVDQERESALELEVEKFKRRLDNYGEINPMALEAYTEMEERFVHIKEQRSDIVEAKESLISTISEIEETATALFLESFEEVRKHFVVVFRSLFTKDDDCDLILENPDDPLNSKIEIIAKPKGKRPKSLSQLSGGEKTLTATALLFSLYLLKPAPFCIFDEVDAPLDDTNIQKFANIIRAFSDKSQFIIVTHNKATMAEVDVLYGVFMEKKGVSSVSSVDFRSYEDKGAVQNTSLKTVN